MVGIRPLQLGFSGSVPRVLGRSLGRVPCRQESVVIHPKIAGVVHISSVLVTHAYVRKPCTGR